jgi:hypothetical protein
VKWPGYLENYNAEDDPYFPPSLHFYDLPILKQALENAGFSIEFCEYLDGKANHAVEEIWHDGREYLGVIAFKEIE